MTYDPKKVALICQGTFDTLQTGTQGQAQRDKLLTIAGEIGGAGFGTVVLGQWHVHADGSVYYNEQKYYPEGTSAPPGSLDFAWILAEIPKALRAAGNVTNVMLEFGGWDCNDMAHMYTAETAFQKTMQEIFDKYPDISGLDFDPEGSSGGESVYNSDTASGLVATAQWAAQQGKVVTCIPCADNDWWTDSVLAPLTNNYETIFGWWSLQGADKSSYNAWVGYVQPYIKNSGNFIVFGFNFDKGNLQTPTAVQKKLATVVAAYPNLDGAILWRYEDIENGAYTVEQYATAMQNGLNGQSS